MDEDISGLIVALVILLVIILSIAIPFCYAKNRDIELEKYRIEMQVKHGDIAIEEGE